MYDNQEKGRQLGETMRVSVCEGQMLAWSKGTA